jgi:hypothetical protein
VKETGKITSLLLMTFVEKNAHIVTLDLAIKGNKNNRKKFTKALLLPICRSFSVC